jgi:hypothetical protein
MPIPTEARRAEINNRLLETLAGIAQTSAEGLRAAADLLAPTESDKHDRVAGVADAINRAAEDAAVDGVAEVRVTLSAYVSIPYRRGQRPMTRDELYRAAYSKALTMIGEMPDAEAIDDVELTDLRDR